MSRPASTLERLAAKRNGIRWSAYEIAVLAGLDPDLYEAQERGQAPIQPWDVRKAANAVAVAARWEWRDARRTHLKLHPRKATRRLVLASPRRFGESMIRARNGLDVDLLEMGRELGIRWQALSDLERGQVRMGKDRLISVCDYLGLPVPAMSIEVRQSGYPGKGRKPAVIESIPLQETRA